jgi:DNA invertase Pin-like site-specific DNA recombinase
MKQTVVIYTRVSTDKQTTDSQLASLREYCARHNWRDVQVITDTISGSKISRKGLDALMKAVRAGKVDVVLCYNLDRLGRPDWYGSFFAAVRYCGVSGGNRHPDNQCYGDSRYRSRS